MTETDIQQLLDKQTDAAMPDTTALLQSALDPLMPLISVLVIASVILTVIMVLYFIVNIVQKQRQHSAIMRIDRNLQKLVDAQLPTETPAATEPATAE